MNEQSNLLVDAHGFSRIYSRFHRPILDYVLGRVRDREVAEEVTQEVFLKAYKARESFLPQYALSTWIWTIARNTVFDWIRKHRSMGHHVSHNEETETAACEELPCNRPTAEGLMLEKSRRQRLRDAMRKLPRIQRKVLLLRLVRELSCQEIARRLKISIPSVKCSLYRARLMLTAQ